MNFDYTIYPFEWTLNEVHSLMLQTFNLLIKTSDIMFLYDACGVTFSLMFSFKFYIRKLTTSHITNYVWNVFYQSLYYYYRAIVFIIFGNLFRSFWFFAITLISKSKPYMVNLPDLSTSTTRRIWSNRRIFQAKGENRHHSSWRSSWSSLEGYHISSTGSCRCCSCRW